MFRPVYRWILRARQSVKQRRTSADARTPSPRPRPLAERYASTTLDGENGNFVSMQFRKQVVSHVVLGETLF